MTIFTIWFDNFPNNLVILLAAAAIAGAFVFVFALRHGHHQSSCVWLIREREDASLCKPVNSYAF